MGIVAILLVLVSPGFIGGVLVFLWANFSRTPLREIGYIRPKNWIGTFVAGIAIGVALKFFVKAIAMPLLGANPVNPTYHYLIGNPAALASMAIFVIVSGGFGEETVYRGFLFERFDKSIGSGIAAKMVTVVLTAALFSAAHYYDQGIPGVEQAVFTGLALGSIFAISGKIWIPIIAHAAYDIAAIALIYWNLETTAAHLIFK